MTITIKGRLDLIRTTPSLMGFQPEESVVLHFFDPAENGRLFCSARLDVVDIEAVYHSTVDTVLQQSLHPDHVEHHAVIFAAERPDVSLLDQADEIIYVKGNRFWTLPGCGGSCCPAEGVEFDPGEVPVALAEMTLEGLAVAGGRDELIEHSAPKNVTESARQQALELCQILTRDREWTAIEGVTETAELTVIGERWLEVARHAGDVAAPAYFLSAWAFWRAGNGARARISLDRTLEIDPFYSAGRILATALEVGVNPTQLKRLDPADLVR